jgi:hypothetical protein
VTLFLCLSLGLLGAVAADTALSGWQKARRLAALRGKKAANISAIFMGIMSPRELVGSAAPDFTLTRMDDGRPVRLGDFRGREPVVLVFGSFGCSVFCAQIPALRRLHQTYGDRAAFLFIYIREASHAPPEALQHIADDPAAPPDPEANRRWRLRAALEHFRLSLPCLLDTDDARVEGLYQAWPTRLLLVDRAGRVALDSGNSPDKPFPWEEAEAWLDGQGRPPGHHERRDDQTKLSGGPDK